MVSKARGNKMALNKLVELVKEYTASVAPRSLLMVLAYCNCPARAEGLKKALLEHCARPGNCDCPHRRPFHHVC